MARLRWLAAAGAGLLVVAGCSSSKAAHDLQTVDPAPVSPTATAPTSEVVEPGTGQARIQTPDGLVTVDLATGTTTFLDGLVNADWTRIATLKNGVGRLVDAESRRDVRSAQVPDGLSVAAIASSGNQIAFSDAPEYGVRGLPKGKARTRVAILSSSSSSVQVLDLEGNLVPEAFSTDERDLFVLDYVPAMAPDHYLVRMINLRDGINAKIDVGSNPKLPPDGEQMQGNARNSLYSPGRDMLFTLYSEYGEQGHAFVHALDLTNKWSYCIDLPDDGHFGDGQATLAMSYDNALYVIGDSGQIAQIDAQPFELKVLRSAQLPAATPAKNRTTAAVEGNSLIVGHDERVFFVDRSTLRVDQTITMSAAVIGLTGDGHGRVGIATPTAIDVLEPSADTRRTGLDTNLTGIVRFGLE